MENTRQNETKRIEYIDVAKGAAMILVILGHALSDSLLKNMIYSFHMPLFFFVSGYFFKPRKMKNLTEIILKRYVLPYVLTAAIIILLSFIIELINSSFYDALDVGLKCTYAALYGSGIEMNIGFAVPSIGAIWFLLAISIGYIIMNIACKYNWSGILVVVLAVIGIVTVRFIWLPLSIQPGMTCSVFLYSGWICRKYSLIDKFNKYWINAMSFIIWGVGAYLCGHMYMVNNSYESGILNFVVAFFGIHTALIVSILIDSHIYILKKALLFIGQNTLIVLCVHVIELHLVPWHNILLKIMARYGINYFIVIAFFICIKLLLAVMAIFAKKKVLFLQRVF